MQRRDREVAVEFAHEGALLEAGVDVELLWIFLHSEVHAELTTNGEEVPLQGLQGAVHGGRGS